MMRIVAAKSTYVNIFVYMKYDGFNCFKLLYQLIM
jgi:hypothetical protein